MSYFCVFNKKGWILKEEGIAPTYLNSVISSIDPSTLSGSRTVRDDKVEYEIRGPIVYLSIGGKKSLRDRIQDENFNYTVINNSKNNLSTKDVDDLSNMDNIISDKDKSNKNKSIKNSNDIYSLDYSSHSVRKSVVSFDTKKLVRKFNFFSKEIPVNELRNKMEIQLVRKNVDYNITKILTDCVINELNDVNLEFVTPELFRKYMGNVLNKIIPSVDHNKFIKDIKETEGVYTICFVGVNGVGKSTSLSKMCYYLLNQNLKVYIAACDTFRAGAVEQLKVHVERFREGGYNVGFYEKGYGKDDTSVARTAIYNAVSEGYDVVLIDTAGRMHNKKTLMDSLSKLIRLNNPNHIVYVGEALVGTDSLLHIQEFNKAIGKGVNERRIDSIILTKVDTVDEKIGQILNMTFSSNSPILFLGTGQTNSDLVKIDSDEIINILMSD